MKKRIFKPILITILLLTVALIILFPTMKQTKLGLDLQGGFEVLYQVESLNGEDVTNEEVTATYKAITKRIDVLGVLEPEITIEGNDKIRVQLAGISNADQARNIISQTASLSFRDSQDNLLMNSDVLRSGGAKLATDNSGKYVVSLGVKDKDTFYKQTKKVSEMSNNEIVIWLDFEPREDSFSAEQNKCGTSDSNCISAATVSQGFSSDVQIEGNFTQEEAQELVDLINSGSLPTKLTEISSQSVEASFGSDSLQKTITAGAIGILLIIVFLIFVYRFAGFITSVGIIVFSSLTLFVFWLIGGTLTLPGIAALIIGVGMAVDSNVISFSRIKEELYSGKHLKTAYKYGNKSSFSSIIDANLTTLLVAIILFIFGQSSVKGFATMLMITIFSTLVIMVFLTRWLLKKYVETGKFDEKLKFFIGVNSKDVPNISKKEKRTKFFYKKLDFVKNRKIFLIIAAIIVALGLVFVGTKGLNLGVDFKGGTVITMKTDKTLNQKDVTKEIENSNYKVYNYEVTNDESTVIKVDSVLTKEQQQVLNNDLSNKYNSSTNIDVVSNVVKQELIKNALLSVLFALIGIIVYMSIRFKTSYAVSGIIALLINILVTTSLFSIFNLEVSSIFIAAILSIIGYSINDVIITFDRIRENYKKKKEIKKPQELIDIVNQSLRDMLNRSIITTVTTLIPVVCLIFLGSHEIITFNLALLFGLIIGTLSSIFIASQLWLEIEKKTIGKEKKENWRDMQLDEVDELEIKGVNS